MKPLPGWVLPFSRESTVLTLFCLLSYLNPFTNRTVKTYNQSVFAAGDGEKASSTAANLYAALAADCVEDEDMVEEPPPPMLVAPRQILVTAGGQILNQRVVMASGQHYVVAQPQTALVQVLQP